MGKKRYETEFKVLYGEELDDELLYRIFVGDQEIYAWDAEYIGEFENLRKRYYKFKKSIVCLMDGEELVGYICFFPVEEDMWRRIVCPGEDDIRWDEDHIYELIPDDDIGPDDIPGDPHPERRILYDEKNGYRIENFDEEEEDEEEEFEDQDTLKLFIISAAIREKYRKKEYKASLQLSDAWIAYMNAIQESLGTEIEAIAAVTVSEGGLNFVRSRQFGMVRRCRDSEGSVVYCCDGDRLARLLEDKYYLKGFRDDVCILLPFETEEGEKKISHIPLSLDDLPDEGELPLYSRYLLNNVKNSRDFECRNEVRREVTEHYLGSFYFLHTLDDYKDEEEDAYGECPTLIGEDRVELSLLMHRQTHMYVLLMFFPDCRYSTSQILDQVSKNYLKIRSDGWETCVKGMKDETEILGIKSWKELGMYEDPSCPEAEEYKKRLLEKEMRYALFRKLDDEGALDAARLMEKAGLVSMYTGGSGAVIPEKPGSWQELIAKRRSEYKKEALKDRERITGLREEIEKLQKEADRLLEEQLEIKDFKKREAACRKYKKKLGGFREEGSSDPKGINDLKRELKELEEKAGERAHRRRILKALAALEEEELAEAFECIGGFDPDEDEIRTAERRVNLQFRYRQEELAALGKIILSHGCYHYAHLDDYVYAMYGLVMAGYGKVFSCMTGEPEPQPGEDWVRKDDKKTTREMMNILSGETYFSLFQTFRVYNDELIEKAVTDVSAYDYYTAYMSRQTVVFILKDRVLKEQLPDDDYVLECDVSRDSKEYGVLTRIGLAATCLFIMELIMFQNTALSKMTVRVSKALTQAGHVPWKYINRLYEDYGKTIEFWKTDNFKYNGTAQEAEKIRTAFTNDDLKAVYAEQQEYLQKIVDLNSAEQERRNGVVINILGVVFAIFGVKEYVVEEILTKFYDGLPDNWIADTALEANRTFNVLAICGFALAFLIIYFLNRRSYYYRMRRLKNNGSSAAGNADGEEQA